MRTCPLVRHAVEVPVAGFGRCRGRAAVDEGPERGDVDDADRIRRRIHDGHLRRRRRWARRRYAGQRDDQPVRCANGGNETPAAGQRVEDRRRAAGRVEPDELLTRQGPLAGCPVEHGVDCDPVGREGLREHEGRAGGGIDSPDLSADSPIQESVRRLHEGALGFICRRRRERIDGAERSCRRHEREHRAGSMRAPRMGQAVHRAVTGDHRRWQAAEEVGPRKGVDDRDGSAWVDPQQSRRADAIEPAVRRARQARSSCLRQVERVQDFSRLREGRQRGQ